MVNFLRSRRRQPTERLWLLAEPDEPCAGSGISPENSGFDHGGGVAMRPRLNALFAFSVNSPSMSMVNFPCVVSALTSSACRVTRRVTPQPMRAAVRREAGADA